MKKDSEKLTKLLQEKELRDAAEALKKRSFDPPNEPVDDILALMTSTNVNDLQAAARKWTRHLERERKAKFEVERFNTIEVTDSEKLVQLTKRISDKKF